MSAPTDATFDPDEVPSWLASLFSGGIEYRSVLAGVNQDDCAVLCTAGGLLVLSTDFFNARPLALEAGIGGLGDLGRLLVGANLSDLCGTGAAPTALLLGVQMPRESMLSDFEELIRGVSDEARRWQLPVVGGDTKLGSSLSLYAVAVGMAESMDELYLRMNAQPGDSLWVSGPLGGCCAAILGLKWREFGPEDRWTKWAGDAILRPTLPLPKSRALSAKRIAHAGTDLSDGLGTDLAALCQASGVGVILDASSIPMARVACTVAEAMGVPDFLFAFPIGGDFQFIVTAPPDTDDDLAGLGFVRIGEITSHQTLRIRLADGRELELPTAGHRDARAGTFEEEVKHLLEALSQAMAP